MARYEYRGNGQFSDNQNDRVIDPGDVVEIEPSLVEAHAFVRVDSDSDTEDSNNNENQDSGTHKSDADPRGEADETPLTEMDYSELATMAMEADTDEIHGRSSREEIIAYFSE